MAMKGKCHIIWMKYQLLKMVIESVGKDAVSLSEPKIILFSSFEKMMSNHHTAKWHSHHIISLGARSFLWWVNFQSNWMYFCQIDLLSVETPQLPPHIFHWALLSIAAWDDRSLPGWVLHHLQACEARQTWYWCHPFFKVYPSEINCSVNKNSTWNETL